jgi:hypothetical protein
VRLYAHAGVHREAAVPVGQHVFGLKALQQAPAHEGVQNASAQGGLHLGHGGRIDNADRVVNHFAGSGLTVGHSLGVGVGVNASISTARQCQRAIALHEVAQALGHRQHPLAHRQAREDVIGEMRRRLHHAPRVARGADTPAFAGEGHEVVVRAVSAAGTGKAVGKDAAFEVFAKRLAHIGLGSAAVALPDTACVLFEWLLISFSTARFRAWWTVVTY